MQLVADTVPTCVCAYLRSWFPYTCMHVNPGCTCCIIMIEFHPDYTHGGLSNPTPKSAVSMAFHMEIWILSASSEVDLINSLRSLDMRYALMRTAGAILLVGAVVG